MEAFKIMSQWWDALQRLFVYAQFCAENPISAPVCHDFWIWTILSSLGFALLIALTIGKSVIKEQLEFYRNRKRLEARAIVADEETINQHKWIGDSASDVNFSQEELAAKIRKAIKSNK